MAAVHFNFALAVWIYFFQVATGQMLFSWGPLGSYFTKYQAPCNQMFANDMACMSFERLYIFGVISHCNQDTLLDVEVRTG